MTAISTLSKAVKKIGNQGIRFDRKNVRDMGLVDTGKSLASMKTVLSFDGTSIILRFFVEDYLAKFNRVRKGSEIKFNFSDLRSWAARKQPGLSAKQVDSFLFATIKKWRKEGLPTRASVRFSKTGKRTGWVDDGDRFLETNIESLEVDLFFEELFDELVTESK